MLCCPCIGQLTLSLEEQGQNLKVSMCYSAQGALSVCLTLPGGVVVAVHCCLAVNCIGIHWLQQNREHLSAAIVMGQTACSIAMNSDNNRNIRSPAHDELGTCRASVDSQEQLPCASL